MAEERIFVVIPTLNRHAKLNRVVKQLNNQTKRIYRVVIVDSSENIDENLDQENKNLFYIHTEKKSASTQRNIGIDYVFNNFDICDQDYITFIDDDLILPEDYIERLYFGMSLGFNGFSGISRTLNDDNKYVQLILNLFMYLFWIKRKNDGKVLVSGFANQVKKKKEQIIEVSWIICCAMWRAEDIRHLRFDENIPGYSLGEDVIFSTAAKYKNNLILGVDLDLGFINDNEEEKNERSSEFFTKNYYMREQVVKNLGRSKNEWQFTLATIGIEIIRIMAKIKNVFK
jgi:glycosyltransferase involved in cell wall biosynthesis